MDTSVARHDPEGWIPAHGKGRLAPVFTKLNARENWEKGQKTRAIKRDAKARWPLPISRNSWHGILRLYDEQKAVGFMVYALAQDLQVRPGVCQHCGGPFRGDQLPLDVLRGAWCHPNCLALYLAPLVGKARQLIDRYAKSLKNKETEIA